MLVGLEPYGAMRGYANPLDPAEVFGWDFAPNDWALSLLGRPELGLRPLLTDAIVGAARALQGRSCGNLSVQLIAYPLSWLVPSRARSEGFLAPSDLAAEARAGLERLSEIDVAGPFADYGLSPEVRSRRRQLGLDPAGPLEHLVRVEGVTGDETWPIWRVVIELLRVREEPWEAVHERLVTAAPELRPRDWLAVWFEIYGSKQARLAAHTYAYGELWNQQWAVVPTLLERAPDEERLAWAKTYHAELRRWPLRLGAMSCLILYELCVRGMQADERLPEEYDTDIAPGFAMPIREVLERVPEARLVRILTRLMESGGIDVTTASSFLDLAPDLLPVLFADIEARKGYDYIRASDGHIFDDDGAYVRAINQSPRLRELHQAYLARPRPDHEPPPDRSKWTLWP